MWKDSLPSLYWPLASVPEITTAPILLLAASFSRSVRLMALSWLPATLDATNFQPTSRAPNVSTQINNCFTVEFNLRSSFPQPKTAFVLCFSTRSNNRMPQSIRRRYCLQGADWSRPDLQTSPTNGPNADSNLRQAPASQIPQRRSPTTTGLGAERCRLLPEAEFARRALGPKTVAELEPTPDDAFHPGVTTKTSQGQELRRFLEAQPGA